MIECGVREFFRGKSILITGGGGFIGKVLIEKLLHSCPDVREIFVLIRAKRGKNEQERFKEILESEVFHRVKNRSNLISKITPIYGDVRDKYLGLKAETLELVTTSSNIVFHLAASLQMNSSLKSSINANLTGTKNVFDMCKKMKNLSVVLYLSTAFCNCDQEVCDEKVYDWPLNSKDLMKLTDDELKILEKLITKTFPNSYIFTKRMAEILARDEFKESQLNVCIVRPSVVAPSWREPMSGWVDTMNGLASILNAAGKGVLRTMICEGKFHVQVIPVDQAVAGIIAIAQRVGSERRRPSQISVFNVTCSEKKLITSAKFLEKIKRFAKIYPLEPGLWYPDGDITMNPMKHYLTMITTMWLPALFIDFILLITFQRPFMIRLQKKIFDGLSVFEYFSTREWIIKYKNFESVYISLSEEEQKIFNMNTEEVDEDEYLRNFVLGGRRYCLKESPGTIERSRVFLKIQLIADLTLKAFLMYFFGRWFLCIILNECQAKNISLCFTTLIILKTLYQRISTWLK